MSDPMLRLAVEAQDRYIAEQVAALRELEAYARNQADALPPVAARVYLDMADRIRAILGNVTGVEEPV